ncbi:MAG: RNA polymerase sigma factor SigZ [Cytophagaceae bacterium]
MEIAGIHKDFHKLLYNFIVKRVKDKSDAEDILQEVFIKIATKIDSLDEDEKLKSWIFTIARNTIIDYYRKNSNNTITEITEKIKDEFSEVEDNDATKGMDKCLAGFIQKLPDEYRDVIIDSELKGIKQKDLAVKYNIAYPSLRSRVQRGRSRLKAMLLNCCKIKSDSRGNIIDVESKNPCDGEEGNCG